MNNQEAIEVLNTKYHIEGPIKDVCDEVEARVVAVEALEKQIPINTKVIVREEDTRIGYIVFKAGTKVHYCPKCGAPAAGSHHYCCNCGQALIRRIGNLG